LAEVEKDIVQIDKYVEFCYNKYKAFDFSLDVLNDDERIKTATYVTNHEV